MAAPYVLNLDHFEQLCKARGFATQADFMAASGIPHRTFYSLAGSRDVDFRGATIAMFLDAFPGTSFEYLFTRTAAPVQMKAAA